MDREARRATGPGVAKSWTRLNDEQTPNRIKLSLGLGLKSRICFASFPFFLVFRCLPLLFFWENSIKSYLYTNSHLNVCFERAPSQRHMHPGRQAGLALQNRPSSLQPFQVHKLVSKVGLESLQRGRQEPDSKYSRRCRLHIITSEALLTPGLGCFPPRFSL